MKATIKRYAISSTVTFIATFIATLGVELQAGLPPTLTAAFFIGLFGVAFRAGVKMAIESLFNNSGDNT